MKSSIARLWLQSIVIRNLVGRQGLLWLIWLACQVRNAIRSVGVVWLVNFLDFSQTHTYISIVWVVVKVWLLVTVDKYLGLGDIEWAMGVIDFNGG